MGWIFTLECKEFFFKIYQKYTRLGGTEVTFWGTCACSQRVGRGPQWMQIFKTHRAIKAETCVETSSCNVDSSLLKSCSIYYVAFYKKSLNNLLIKTIRHAGKSGTGLLHPRIHICSNDDHWITGGRGKGDRMGLQLWLNIYITMYSKKLTLKILSKSRRQVNQENVYSIHR